jgi:ADP-ribose pyrophosphatase YjhB (NUDIX family)
LEVRVRELLGVYIDRYDNHGDEIFTLNHYYVVEPIGGQLRAADDVNEFGWFALDVLPEQIAFVHARVVLRDLQLNWTRTNADERG